jgi:hypothetical protein
MIKRATVHRGRARTAKTGNGGERREYKVGEREERRIVQMRSMDDVYRGTIGKLFTKQILTIAVGWTETALIDTVVEL